MSVFKTTFTRALAVIPTDNANVPYPAQSASGTNDIVYNTTDGTAATVLVVVSQTSLLLNDNIFTATAKTYKVYTASPQTSNGNPGCFLYVGGAGNVKVTTIGQDVVTFTAVPVGTVLPVQVVKVHSSASGTTATLINALW